MEELHNQKSSDLPNNTDLSSISVTIWSLHIEYGVATEHALNRANLPLMALHDLTTDAPIPRFPGTIAQITAMQGADVNNLLTALNLQVNGTVPERRQRLRLHIGLLAETA